MKTYLPPKFSLERDTGRCIQCQVCVNQCSFDVYNYDAQDDEVRSREDNCVGCHRCVVFCPTNAVSIRKNPLDYRENYNWRPDVIEDIIKQYRFGKKVTIIEMLPKIGLNIGKTSRWTVLGDLKYHGIELITMQKLRKLKLTKLSLT